MEKALQNDGYHITIGVLNCLYHRIGTLLTVFIVISFLTKLTGCSVDYTDQDKWNRSGLKPLTYAKTGIQYLSDGKGGITPRLEATSKTH